MFKNAIPGILALFVVVLATSAGAQDTIGIYADFGEGGELSRSLITKTGEPFDIVVVTKTDHTSELIQFEMTELQNIFAGVFKYSTYRFGGSVIAYGDEDVGEQAFGYGECAQPGENEVLRIRYFDVDGSLPDNVVLSVFDPGPDNSYLEMQDGQMLYVDCTSEAYHDLAPEPWDDDSAVDPMRIEGLTTTDGILILNPKNLTVPTDGTSFSTLKSRF